MNFTASFIGIYALTVTEFTNTLGMYYLEYTNKKAAEVSNFGGLVALFGVSCSGLAQF